MLNTVQSRSRVGILMSVLLLAGVIGWFTQIHVAFGEETKTYPYEETWINNNKTTVFDGTTAPSNPFAKDVTDQELDTHFAGKESGDNTQLDHIFVKYKVTYKDGTVKYATTPQFGNVKDVVKFEAFEVFQPQVGNKDWPYTRTSFSAWGGGWKAERTQAGGLIAAPFTQLTCTAILNGDTDHAVVSKPDDPKSGEPIVGMYEIKGRQYIHFILEDILDPYTVLELVVHPIKETQRDGGISVESSGSFAMLIPKTEATFHYVDDFEYRNLDFNKINKENVASLPAGSISPLVALPERSADTAVYSDAAFTPRDLRDLVTNPVDGAGKQVITHESAFFYLQNGDGPAPYEYRSPLLKPEGDYAADANGCGSDTKEGIVKESKDFYQGGFYTDKERPITLTSLTSAYIPGYVYIDNDIDKKPEGTSYTKRGNWIISAALSSENKLLTQQDYYLTYRAIPRKVTIKKTDAQTKKEIQGATFSLYYKDEKGEFHLIREGLTTNQDGIIQLGKKDATIDELRALVKKPEALKEWYNHIYVDGDDIYLMPGEYVLRETHTPEGYEKPEKDAAFTVEKDADETGASVEVGVENSPSTPPTPGVPPTPEVPPTPGVPPTPDVPPTTPPAPNIPPTPGVPPVEIPYYQGIIPKTGDTSPIGGLAAALLISGFAAIGFSVKRLQSR